MRWRTSGARKQGSWQEEDVDEMLAPNRLLLSLQPHQIVSLSFLNYTQYSNIRLAIFKRSRVDHLSDRERREILNYPQVIYIGARSDKKPVTRDNPSNHTATMTR